MVLASKKRTVPVIMAERATNKAQLYKPSVILVRARAPNGNARTELAQVIFFFVNLLLTISIISLYILFVIFVGKYLKKNLIYYIFITSHIYIL